MKTIYLKSCGSKLLSVKTPYFDHKETKTFFLLYIIHNPGFSSNTLPNPILKALCRHVSVPYTKSVLLQSRESRPKISTLHLLLFSLSDSTFTLINRIFSIFLSYFHAPSQRSDCALLARQPFSNESYVIVQRGVREGKNNCVSPTFSLFQSYSTHSSLFTFLSNALR